ncbi:hypothetical protein [Cohaesibacter celericrescens]|uniref:Uncharacterized protein n=1 Tax=Cohaesibacter celericrescens TaxID=2067669 RepID=A0A2N5XQM9_9HYPH|nr:hypothetical protein [Cohaesibacter celericrescens]PLW76747.1 hypothetical protein C0081_11815 [Cohaesibacter celericrescens]
MRALRWMALLIATLLVPSQGLASDLADKLATAETLLVSGQPNAAYEALDELMDAYWQRSPMFVRKAEFATEITGYGIYKPHGSIFKPNEPQIIYVEPIGFGYGTTSDGSSFAKWSIDFALSNPGGTTLFQKDDFLNLALPLGQHNREIHLTLTVNLSGLKPGSYVSHYLLKDANSEKTAKFSMPFKVVQ